jgi:hypothetical protein
MAGSIEHNVWRMTTTECTGSSLDIVARCVGGADKVVRQRKFAPTWTRVNGDGIQTTRAGREGNTEPNRTEANNDDTVVGCGIGATDGVESDGQHLDHGQPIDGNACGVVEMRGRQVDVLTHATVDMYAEDAERFATVGQPALTGTTVAAFEVWADGNDVADCHVCYCVTPSDNLDGEFVPQNTWVIKERLFAGKCMQIRTANADASDASLNFVGEWGTWVRSLFDLHVTDRTQDNLTHANHLFHNIRQIDGTDSVRAKRHRAYYCHMNGVQSNLWIVCG